MMWLAGKRKPNRPNTS